MLNSPFSPSVVVGAKDFTSDELHSDALPSNRPFINVIVVVFPVPFAIIIKLFLTTPPLSLTKEMCNFVKCPSIKESPVSIECKVKEIKEIRKPSYVYGRSTINKC